MKIYQIIYNSSTSDLSGRSGFGVRNVSEGTPQEYIKTVKETFFLYKYFSGKFDLGGNATMLAASPEKIYECPRGYYYRVLNIDSKPVYAIARIVSAQFDYEFYVKGSARTGNYIAHILMTEEYPGKKAFGLLAEAGKEGEMHFIPKDWRPVQTNPEMVELMTGKPQSYLPVLTDEFPELPSVWSKLSLDLLFSYRAALKDQKPIVVSMKDAITSATVAKFMNLLPDSLAKETTFVINHQEDSYAKDVKISFINEYYQYRITPMLYTYINLLDDSRQADKVEEIWRPILEQALNDNDYAKAELLINWIFSRMAEDNVESPANLNEALFNYTHNKSQFTINTIDEVANILEVISKYAKQGDVNADHLNALVIKVVDEANELDDYAKTIDYCEKIHKAGLDTEASKKHIQDKFTEFVISDSERLYNAFVLLKETLLRKYSIVEKYPKFDKIISEILPKQSDMSQIIVFAKYLQNDARARVEAYIRLLDKTPEYISQYSALLDSDKGEAEKADYIAAFPTHLNNNAFANLYYNQVKRESYITSTIKILKKIFDLTEVNTEFTGFILDDKQIYSTLYGRVKKELRKEDYSNMQKAIEDYIFSLLPDDSKDREQWHLLHDVLNLNLKADARYILSFYNLAKEILHIEALKKVSSLCFEVLHSDQIEEFLTLVNQHNIMTDTEIVERALSEKSRHHLSYIIPVAKTYNYDYDRIFDLVMQCGRDEKETKKIIKANFPELYSKHRKETFVAKLKSLFSRKKKDEKDEDKAEKKAEKEEKKIEKDKAKENNKKKKK